MDRRTYGLRERTITLSNFEEMSERAAAKQALRHRMAEQRNRLSLEERAEKSRLACEYACELMKADQVKSFMIYLSFRSELDTRSIIEWAWQSGIRVIVPRSVPEDRTMELYEMMDWSELVPGAYGIMEPDPSRSSRVRDIVPEIIWVPGLAFDRNGGRLGYGGGYYDRLSVMPVEATNPNSAMLGDAQWIGLGYASQVLDHVPTEVHDRILDGLVTEQGYYRMNQSFAGG
ncbi:5-formyltetrahydrofolate cyclo-ligase [Paenibacillus sp. JCM 10914]|uniref:5-formyltetrahydrofolate cyclo-ligase n=1 Tax=Paenibacillus sp. JCM 10914 TaxID=1236974 RepID=UPI0006916272|nr:5-formyltetrahydrofolate cyclo-ligase [Paenibacillus sp. JCM 10914]